MWNTAVAKSPFWTLLGCYVVKENRCPKKSFNCHSLEFCIFGRKKASGWKLQIDDSSLQTDRDGMCSIIGTEFGKDALYSTLDGFLGD